MNKQKIIFKWLNKEFGRLTPVVRGDRVFYVDKNNLPLFYFFQNEKTGLIYINNNRIWLFLESVFIINELEISKLLGLWVENTYNLRGLKPTLLSFTNSPSLEDVYNLTK
jgi:hypothetical protein